jgi:endoribonuclease Dicer
LNKKSADSDRYREILRVCITKVEECIRKMDTELGLMKDNATNILNNSSQKVQKVILQLEHFFTNPNREKDLQCIIFVERRSTAKILYHIVKALANCMPNFPLRPDFVVGNNKEMPESIEAVLNQTFNSVALERFNKNETNCIICTNVLEEGIDIQACNLVIMYDQPTTLRSFIQSCGRARDENSNYIIMLDGSTVAKFHEKMVNWNHVNCEMKKQLIGKTLDRVPPSEEEIQNEQQQSWEPFITKCGSELNALNSIK